VNSIKTIALVLGVAGLIAQDVAAAPLPCIDRGIGINDWLSANLGSSERHARHRKAIAACVQSHSICLLTTKGTVLRADSIDEVRDAKDRVTFGVVQVFSSKQVNLPHCAVGIFHPIELSDNPAEGWSFPVWNPDWNHPGATGGASGPPDDEDEKLRRPLPIAQFLGLVRKYVYQFCNRSC
jgi:hypothetical protein